MWLLDRQDGWALVQRGDWTGWVALERLRLGVAAAPGPDWKREDADVRRGLADAIPR